MNPEITDLEAQVLEDYGKEFMKLLRKDRFNSDIVSLSQSWAGYFHALCVKYNQNPFDMQVDRKTKKWEPVPKE